MKKSLLIAGMMALALTACQYGKNSPEGSMIQGKMACKASGKTEEVCEAEARKAYIAAGGYEAEYKIYLKYKGKKGIKPPKKYEWAMPKAEAAPEAAPAKVEEVKEEVKK